MFGVYQRTALASKENVVNEGAPPKKRRPLISHPHRKRSPLTWIVLLALIIAVMVLLPRLVAVLDS